MSDNSTVSIETNLDTNETIVKNIVNDVIDNVVNNVETLEKTVTQFENDANDEVFTKALNLQDKLGKVGKVAKQNFKEKLEDKQTVFHNVKDSFRGMDIDLSNVMLYLTRTIETVETFFNGSGDEKKQLVVNTIMDLLDDNTNIEPSENEFIRLVLESLIETVIKTSKKEISLTSKTDGKKKEKGKSKGKGIIELSIGQITESIIDKCVTVIKTNKYNAENIIVQIPIIIGMIMSLVENYKNLSGPEKKSVIVKVVKTLVTVKIPDLIQLKKGDQDKLALIIQILPTIIDVLVEIANGKYNINKVASLLKRLFCCCYPSKKKKGK